MGSLLPRPAKSPGDHRLPATIAALLLALVGPAAAQGPIRSSLAGSDAAASTRAGQARPYYNLRLGEFFFRADAAFGVEFNDNVNLADQDSLEGPEADLIIRPRVNISASWQVTKRNELRVNLGFGVERYLQDPTRDQTTVSIAPGSELSFDVYVGDFKFNFRDQFSIEQDPVSEGSISNASKLGRFTNTLGASVLWDLNHVILGADYNLTSVTSISSGNAEAALLDDYLRNSLQLSARFPAAKGFFYGASTTFALTDYLEESRPDTSTISVGPFIELQLTTFTALTLNGGYRIFTFDNQANENQDLREVIGFIDEEESPEDTSGSFFGEFGIFNRVNQFYRQNLAIGVETENGFYNGTTRTTYIRYSAQWAVNSRISLGLESFYDRSTQEGTETEEYSRFGVGLSTSFYLTRRLNAGLTYRFTSRESDLPLRNYLQNLFGVQLSYAF